MATFLARACVLVVATTLAGCAADSLAPKTPALPESQGLALTIYSNADPGTFDPLAQMRSESQGTNYYDQRVPGYGVVRDTRKFPLKPGPNPLQFTEVAAGIDPTTVSFRSVDAGPELAMLEQNFRFDMFSSDKLLKKYVGRPITISDSKSGPAGAVSGTLLAATGGDLILRAPDGTVRIVSRGSDGRSQIALGQGGEAGLITKPTLELVVQAAAAAERTAQVTYQTDNLTWRADYSLLLRPDDKAADLNTWVTLVNQSGASYPNTQLKLIAGDVRRFQPVPTGGASASGGLFSTAAADTGFKENSFFEYHMYSLGRTVDLPDNSIKQIELVTPRLGLAVEKVFVFDLSRTKTEDGNGDFTDKQTNGAATGKIDVCIRIKNTQANQLGIPLPAGRVRVYKKDAGDGAPEFVGEDVIDHTPKDEIVTVVIGKAFDITGTFQRTDVQQDDIGRIVQETYQVTLRNHKTEAVRILIRELPNPSWWWRTGGWRVTECTEKYEVPNTRVLLIPVDVAKDGEKKVTFTIRYDGR